MPRGPSDVRTASATALAATMLLSRTLPEESVGQVRLLGPHQRLAVAERSLTLTGGGPGLQAERPLLANIAQVCCSS